MNNFSDESLSRIDTLSAMIIGYALTYAFNSYVQNALGNWFMLVGQVLETNATFLQLYQYNDSNNQNNNNNSNNNSCDDNDLDLDKLKEAISIMQEKIDELIKNNN